MLNRRNLRIKVMQSLFAFHQGQEANHQIAKNAVQQKFTPDLNSMEVQDKEMLKKLRKEAEKSLDDVFKAGTTDMLDGESVVGMAVVEVLEDFKKQGRNDRVFFRKSLVKDAEEVFDHYVSVLSLGCAFADVAKADKKLSHTNFIKNSYILALQRSPELSRAYQKMGRVWDNRMDRVRVWFRDIVRQDNEYLAYLDKKNPSFDDQKKFANHFYRRIVLGKNLIHDHFEEEVLRWAEDKDIVKGMVEKTIKVFDPASKEPLTLHKLSLNWDEDREFMEVLYDRAVDLEQPYRELISNNTRNWEVDRLPLMDRVILEMALAEILSFQNIPVKVTINEYIELAKNYSTPKSRQFVNGILDVMAKELDVQGAIRKSGRGLIDNK